ncbi:NERD domain-containing protein [Alicyclobacillus fructus]|uniref:NERD domain-containing protein n=1 Tax=Alicyclobacillus fructus TaxID=2816082 RepID=UPI001A8D36E8|nr:NERD domain-containing protein [Alicyclobacillus fructus]
MKTVYVVAILTLVLLMAYLLRNPQFIGYAGERIIRKRLSSLPRGEYRVLHNLLVPREDGKRTQIDHVVVSPYGIFVIETKNYQGIIVGKDAWNEWTQVLNRRTKHRFLSPVVQNEGHIRALAYAVPEVPRSAFRSIVAFNDKARLDVESQKAEVVRFRDVAKAIRAHRDLLISAETVNLVVERLQSVHIKGDKARQEHIKGIREMKRQLAANICPRCGGELVIRKGQRGEFYGCSNYPRCRFTRPV